MNVSVALALYNGEKYLVEQLDSIRAQTHAVDEVILCDDCSTDQTYHIAKDYIQKYELSHKWILSQNKHNLGYASNFHHIIKRCRGDYIFFCDQDDLWLPDRIEKMVSIMKSNPNILMLGSEYEHFSSTSDAPKINKCFTNIMSNNGSLEHVQLNAKTIFIGCEGCTMCIRRSFYHKIDQYWFNGWAHDEFVWKMSLVLNGCFIYHYNTLKRRLHSSNVSKRKMRNIEERISFLSNLKKGHERMLLLSKEINSDACTLKLINKNIRSVDLRIALLQNKKILNFFKLALGYSNNYHSKKSILVELYMLFKSEKSNA